MKQPKIVKKRSVYVKNISTLVAGTSVAQAISLAAAPVIARQYTPAEIGAFTFLISIAGGISLVASLRYEMAIILPKDRKDSVNIMFLSLFLAAIISVLFFIMVLIETWCNLTGIGGKIFQHRWISILPALIFLLSASSILQNWFNHNREYKTLAWSKVITSTFNNLTTLFLGLAAIGTLGLWLGNFAGVAATVLFFTGLLYLRYKDDLMMFSFSTQKSMARKYRHLPMANTPQVVVDMAQAYGPVYLLSIFFSNTILGWYSLSLRMLQAPMWLIGSSIGQVFYKDAAEYFVQHGNLRQPIQKTIKTAVAIALPVMVILIIAGPWLMSFVFGSQWREAGVYARILAPWMFFEFIRSTIYSALLVTGKVRSMLIISLIGAALIILPLCLGGLLFRNDLITLILLSACQSIYSLSVVVWIVRSTSVLTKPDA
jgi:O-antigen/teichoic acid export membrane protein